MSNGDTSNNAGETWFERLFARLGLRHGASIREDIQEALADQADTADFSAQERALLKNVLGFRQIRVRDVMVPRADIIAVPASISMGELLGVFRTAGHSRLPAFGETLDDPKGMVHIRDFLDHLAAHSEAGKRRRRRAQVPAAGAEPAAATAVLTIALDQPLATAKLLRPVLFAPPSMPALDLLVRMQATRTHMALVIDEYGGTDGLVSMEDIVEVIVGDIEDEHDDLEGPLIQQLADGIWMADARIDLDEASEALGLPLREEEIEEDIDTIGGLIVLKAGRVPTRGETVAGPGDLAFEIVDADARRVKRVRILARAPFETPAGAGPAVPAGNETPPA
jgi:CBS domain containing-hemolysin-like protein